MGIDRRNHKDNLSTSRIFSSTFKFQQMHESVHEKIYMEDHGNLFNLIYL